MAPPFSQKPQISQISLKIILREKEFWLLLLLGILFFYRPLFLNESFFLRDLSAHFVPQRQLLIDFFKARELPLWDPYLQQPYVGHISNSAFYPSNLLYLCLPLLRAFNLEIVLHFLGYLGFTYLLARLLGFHPLSSLIAGVVYGFGGYTLSLINILNLFWAMAYLPLLVCCWHLFLSDGQKKWYCLTVMIGVIQVFASAPEVSVISLLTLLGWTWCYPYPGRTPVQKWVFWLSLDFFILGLASVHLVPAFEMLSQAPRGQGVPYSAFTKWSLAPRFLPDLIFPEFFGDIATLLPDTYYWGGNVLAERNPYMISIYVGAATLLLFLIGGLHKGPDRIFTRRFRRFLFLLGIVALLFALGRFLPGFHFLHQHVPMLTIFRYPIKCLLAGLLPLALLAGDTAERHFASAAWQPSAKFLILLWGGALIFVLLTMAVLRGNDLAAQLQTFFFDRPPTEVMRQGLGAALRHATGIWFLLTLLYQYRRLRCLAWQPWLLAGILSLDLLAAGKHVNDYVPETFFTEVPATATLIRQAIGEGSLFRPDHPTRFTLQAASNEASWLYRWNIEVLDGSFAVLYRLPVMFYDDIVELKPVPLAKLKAAINSAAWPQRLPLLAVSGVSVILTTDDVALPGLERIAEIPNRSNLRFYLYRNATAVARVAFVTKWQTADSDDEALGKLLQADYEPREQVVLQENGSVPLATSHSSCNVPAQIAKLAANSHAAVWAVSNRCAGYLVFTEPWYPGWRVFVDGKPTPLFRANLAFSAIFLPAGEHRLERFYRPDAILFGAIGSLIFGGLLWAALKKYKG